MLNLPKRLVDFFLWWALKMPKKIVVVSKRFLAILNNQFSFTINLRLFFTPLFGDYTLVGRLIGFTVRMIMVSFGFAFMALLSVVLFVLPVVWLVLPFYLLYEIGLWTTAVYAGLFLFREYSLKDTPEKKVTQVNKMSDSDILKAFRLPIRHLLNEVVDTNVQALPKILADPAVSYILQKSELLKPDFLTKLSEAPSINTPEVAKSALNYACTQKFRYVEMEHLFLGVLINIPKIDLILSSFGSTLKVLEEAVEWTVSKREALSRIYIWQDDYAVTVFGGFGKGMTGRVTPNLDAVSEDFTKKVRKGYIKPIVGRKEEIREIAEILSGSRVNVLIIGDPGSGKTSLVKGMAYSVVVGTEFESLKNKRIVSLEAGALIAGTKTSGDLAQKIKTVMDEVEKSGDIILFIDEIHALVAGTNGEEVGLSSAFSVLEPHLAGERVQFIGATNMENYRKHIEPNGAFARLFNIVELPPTSQEDTIAILRVLSDNLEVKNKITISLPALHKVIYLGEKLIHERVFPDKAIDILNRTAVQVAKSSKFLSAEEVAREISEMTHVPVSAVTEDESRKLLHIEDEMKKRVIGQDAAIKQIGSALKRARVGMRNENKPIASFLFVGTTGVGKTETAKALARTYFGNVKSMVRLDMSEYQQIDSINKLIGSPDGQSKGILTEAVRTKPFTLILLDEIEKAFSSVLLTFLQVLDDGRLTDTTGRVIDFTNSIIIATSNVGTRSIQDIAQNNGAFEQMQESAMKEVREKFAPEFLNRFNGIIVFRPLTMEGVGKIADLMLESVRKMAEDKGVKLSFKPELIAELVKRGYNPQWGARPLARVIENSVESYLAVKLLSNEIKQGDELELGLEAFESSDTMQT